MPQPRVFEPARLGPLTLRNRIVKAATCNKCMPTIYSGTRCVVREAAQAAATPA